MSTIRRVHAATGLVVDPHTADGIKVARDHAVAGTITVCLETALPAKFAETIVEAIGSPPVPPPAYADLEQRPQRFERLANDAEQLKRYVAAHAG